jgi:hypothetical protein
VFKVAVMVALPAATPVMMPVFEPTVTLLVSLLDHTQEVVTFVWLVSVHVAVAVQFPCEPTCTLAGQDAVMLAIVGGAVPDTIVPEVDSQ